MPTLSTRQNTAPDLARLEICGPLAARVDWLRMMTGWHVEVLPAGRGDFLLIASQFTIRHGNAALFQLVSAEELR